MHAGARRVAVMSGKVPYVLYDRWVKAHRDDGEARDAQDKFDITANRAADNYAKAAQSMHMVTAGCKGRMDKQSQKLMQIMRTLIATVTMWPTCSKELGRDRAASQHPGRKEARVLRPHSWLAKSCEGTIWMCRHCLTIARSTAAKERKQKTECPGASMLVATL
eukprot:7079541-Karenia_brevis.AAC.1